MEVKRIFEPKAPSLLERTRGLQAYFEAGIETRLSCMPILPLNPEIFAANLAPFITKRVWIASMNHKQLTLDLFKKHFPEWLDERHVEEVMKQTRETFQAWGVGCFYNSLAPAAKRERYEKREAKIVERKNKINLKTIEKIVERNAGRQPSLFDL